MVQPLQQTMVTGDLTGDVTGDVTGANTSYTNARNIGGGFNGINLPGLQQVTKTQLVTQLPLLQEQSVV